MYNSPNLFCNFEVFLFLGNDHKLAMKIDLKGADIDITCSSAEHPQASIKINEIRFYFPSGNFIIWAGYFQDIQKNGMKIL
jgi:hypothetical protein